MNFNQSAARVNKNSKYRKYSPQKKSPFLYQNRPQINRFPSKSTVFISKSSLNPDFLAKIDRFYNKKQPTESISIHGHESFSAVSGSVNGEKKSFVSLILKI
jgi:hypothetical protein